MSTPISGYTQLPFDIVAQNTIAGAKRVLANDTAPRLPMTAAERAEAEKLAKDKGICFFCGGIHAGMSTPACPRLASGKLNGDGTVVEFTFWSNWDASRVIFSDDIDEEPSGE